MAQRYSEESLRHYGILGQKWGERRYQNPDGTYTEEGLKRKRKDRKLSDRAKKAIKVGAAAAGAAAVAYGVHKYNKNRPVLSKKQIHDLTDDALDKLVDRLDKEKKAGNLQKELYPRMGDFVVGIVNKIGQKTLTQVGTSVAVALGINWMREYLKDIKMPSPKDQW